MRERLATDLPGDASWALPPSRRDRWRATLCVASSGLLIALVLLAVGFGQVAATGVLLIAFLSFVLAYLVAPVAERLRSLSAARRSGRAVSRAIATLAVYALIGAVVAPLWALEGPRFTAALARMRVLVPEHTARFVGQLRASERWHESAGLPVTLGAAAGSLTRVLTRSLEREARAVGAELVDIRGLLPWLAAVPAISFLLLTRWRGFRRSTARVLPTPHLRWRGDEFLRGLNQVLAAYTRAQALSAVIVGVLCWIGFAALGFEHPGTLGLAAGLLEMVPLAGPIVVAVVATALGPDRVVPTLAFLGLLRVVQDYLVYPRLMSRALHLPPLAVVVTLWAGAMLGGLVGIVLAVPLVGAVQVAHRHWREYRDIEQLVSAAAGARGAEAPRG